MRHGRDQHGRHGSLRRHDLHAPVRKELKRKAVSVAFTATLTLADGAKAVAVTEAVEVKRAR